MTSDLVRYGPLGQDNYRRQRGRSARLQLGSPFGVRQTLVYSGATAKGAGVPEGDALSQTMTLTCWSDFTAGPIVPIRGTVRWGNDGTGTEARFDWDHGVAFQVCGSQVELAAELLPPVGGPLTTATAVNVGAFAGYSSVSSFNPRLTEHVTPPGLALPVPRMAARVSFWPSVVGPYTLQALNAAGVVLAEFAPPTPPAGWPIPGGTATINVTTAAPGSFVWMLHL